MAERGPRADRRNASPARRARNLYAGERGQGVSGRRTGLREALLPRIDITDVYLEEEECETYIMADGIDSDGDKRTGFQIYDEQLYDIALFLRYVL